MGSNSRLSAAPFDGPSGHVDAFQTGNVLWFGAADGSVDSNPTHTGRDEIVIKRRALLGNLLATVVAAVLALFAAEVTLRTLGPANDRHFVLPPDQISTLTPLQEFVPGVASTAEYRTSSLGIRGPEMSESDDYRILAIGGSTTQNAYLDQSVTWTLALGRALNERKPSLKTWSGDVGRSGHTARSHVLQIEALLPELPRIDAVVVLVGVNDLTVALRDGVDYRPAPPLDEPGAHAVQAREAFIQIPGPLHERWTLYQEVGVSPLKRTAIYALLRQMKEAVTRARGGTQQDRFGEIYGVWRAHRAAASELLDTLPSLDAPLSEYGRYLTRIATFAKASDTRLVLVTQPTLWREDLSPEEEARLWLGGIGEFQTEEGLPYFTARALAEAMGRYNQVLLDTCREQGVECVDLAELLPADTTVFYDDVHFTEKGSGLVAEHLTQYFLTTSPYSNTASATATRPGR